MSSSLDDVPALIGTNARGFYHELTGGKMLLSQFVYVHRLIPVQSAFSKEYDAYATREGRAVGEPAIYQGGCDV